MLRGSHHTPVRRPCLVVLDLNMPGMGGREFLTELRAGARLRDSVVIVLSTSADVADIRAAYEYQVAGYVVKEIATGYLEGFTALLESYLYTVRLPVER